MSRLRHSLFPETFDPDAMTPDEVLQVIPAPPGTYGLELPPWVEGESVEVDDSYIERYPIVAWVLTREGGTIPVVAGQQYWDSENAMNAVEMPDGRAYSPASGAVFSSATALATALRRVEYEAHQRSHARSDGTAGGLV